MKLAIIGAGEQAKEIVGIVNSHEYIGKEYTDVVMVDLNADLDNNIILEKDFFQFPIEEYEIVIAMGEPSMRKKMYEKYKNEGYTLTRIIHKSASVSTKAIIGRGVVILPFVYVAQDTEIGVNTLIHAGARIENDCKIGANCMISSGAFVGAKTIIGDTTFIGPNSAIRDGLNIGNNVIVGMGSCVLKNISDKAVVVGNPSKQIRDNISGKVFS